MLVNYPYKIILATPNDPGILNVEHFNKIVLYRHTAI
jgi:hypothetical protein